MGLDAQKLTWAALLGRWVEFARSAVALPDDAQGRAWKAAVPSIITLQAITMALREADQLDASERALALDRARILTEQCRAALHELFQPQRLHPMLNELLGDAQQAIAQAEAAP